MKPTHYQYTVIFQLPRLSWEDWKQAQQTRDDIFEFAMFIGAWNIDMSLSSGYPFAFCLRFRDKKKRLEYYRSAFLSAFRGLDIDFRNWSVTDECDTTIFD